VGLTRPARTARGEFLWLETRQVDEARENPNFYLYVVENVRQGDPEHFRLKIYGGEQLQRLLLKAKERRYYEVPVPVAEYDGAGAAISVDDWTTPDGLSRGASLGVAAALRSCAAFSGAAGMAPCPRPVPSGSHE
jgi:hypothetical protein